MRLKFVSAFAVISIGILAISVFVAIYPAAAKASVGLDQCATLPNACSSSNSAQWQNGNLGQSNSSYFEGDSVPYRATFSGLTIGETYSLLLDWDTTQSGKHAIDTLTSYNRTIGSADYCAGITCSGSTSSLSIPSNPNITAEGVGQTSGQAFALTGGTFPASGSTVPNTGNLCADATCLISSNPSAYSLSGTYAGSSSTSIRLWFTADATSAVIAWGGHIASRADWGNDHSAVSISGSPYHMRVNDLSCSDEDNCGVGNQDRSLSSQAVTYAASITVIEVATPEGSTVFDYTSSPAPLSDFTLVDDGTVTNTRTFTGITTFTTYTVSVQSETGWTFTGATCDVIGANGGSQTVVQNTATIDLREGEIVTCTFNHELDPLRSIALDKTVTEESYDSVGDTLSYSYTITNTGEAPIGPTQFTITDDRIASGVAFNCGPADTTLAVDATLTCQASYEVTSADITAQNVMNTAVASGGGLTSNEDQVTVPFVPPGTTTTSTTSTTTTTIPETTTTTSTIPETTTTTSIPETTTTVAETTTTTIVDTTTTTIVDTTTTTPVASTTTNPITPRTTLEPPTTSTSPGITELAETGSRTDQIAAILLVLIGLALALTVVGRRRSV